MKTVLIYNDTGDGISYFVLDGDFRHLQGAYINEWVPEDAPGATETNAAIDELNEILFDEDGALNHKELKKFPVAVVRDTSEEVFVIEVGFMA